MRNIVKDKTRQGKYSQRIPRGLENSENKPQATEKSNKCKVICIKIGI